MDETILPPSKRTIVLSDELKKYSKKGYKTVSQKNFSAHLLKKKTENRRSISMQIRWLLFDIKKLLRYIRKRNFRTSSIHLNVDMYGNITKTKDV